jgi:hypothetical protein
MSRTCSDPFILHLLGFDHEKLTYRYAGRDHLTDVFGNVVTDILAWTFRAPALWSASDTSALSQRACERRVQEHRLIPLASCR